jgi:hypothetical protein
MSDIGKTLILLGLALIVVGGAVLLLGRPGAPRLPGDIVVRKVPVTIVAPIATSILLSIILTVVLNLVLRRR